jgi:hypothetical protein
VLAAELDALLPWTRLLLAGDREGLAAFAASEEFRARFEQGRPLGQAFAAWARRQLRPAGGRPADEAGAAVLAFESMALHAVAHPGPAGLAPGARLVRFAVDLSELHWACAALRRHLLGRAWAGPLPAGAAEGLRQVAQRASPGPWAAALLKRGPGFEVLPLAPALAAWLEQAAAGRATSGPEQAEARALGLLA